jgi:carboxyl-terminal processing protease
MVRNEMPDPQPTQKSEEFVRWAIAGVSFSISLLLVLTMDFGPRGPHFEPGGPYASKLVAKDVNYSLARLRLLSRCVGYIRSNYVDPSRADARKMLLSAMDEVERALPSLISDPLTQANGDTRGLRLQVGGKVREFDLTRVVDLYTMNWRLLDVFEFVAPLVPQNIDSRDIEYAAVNGLLRTLDPHSVLLEPRLYQEMKMGTSGRFGGLGIVIGAKEGHIEIQSVMEGTPAEKAGLKGKDRIVQIGAESTMNMSLMEAVNRLRGPPGTPVVIWILRKSYTEPHRLRIIRSSIRLVSIRSRLLDGNVGYVHIKNFQQNTAKSLKNALETMSRESKEKGAALKGLVLDLRNNPGGLLEQAVRVSDVFLASGKLVTTVGSGNKVREEKVATPTGTYSELPIVVLVNSESASASEIVAGALRNHDRALVIGQKTFGKGSVQVIYEIDDAALKLTIAQYLTPGDESIQGVGITPHVELAPMIVAEKHVELNVESEGGESQFDNHLRNDERVRKHQPIARVQYLESDDAQTDDFPIRLGSRIILEAGQPTASRMFNRARPILALAVREQTNRLVDALGKLEVDWHNGENAKRSNLQATLALDPPSGRVEAGQKVRMTLTVSNKGSSDVHRVRARSRSDWSVFDARHFVLGRIPAGEQRESTVTVNLPRSANNRIVPMSVDLYIDMEAKPIAGLTPASATLEIRGLARPRFSYAIQLDDSDGNGDGVANVGEAITVRARIQNIGDGPSLKLLATLKNPGERGVFITKGRSWMDGLAPGASGEAQFEVEIREAISSEQLLLELRVIDTVLGTRMKHSARLPFIAKSSRTFAPLHEQWQNGPSPTAVYSGAHSDTVILGFLPPKSSLHSDGRAGSWFRVPLTGKLNGWIPADRLERLASGAGVPNQARITPFIQVQQPSIQLTRAIGLETQASELAISGEALFPWTEKGHRPDVYIFRDRDKVYFGAGADQSARRVAFDTTIPLKSGANRVSIHARAGTDLIYKRTWVIFRRDAEAKQE